MKHKRLAPIAAMIFAIIAGSATAAQRYKLIELQSLGGDVCSQIRINNAGLITGVANDEMGRAHPVTWNGSAIVDLLPLLGIDINSETQSRLDFGVALSVNNRGAMALSVRDGDTPARTYVLNKAGAGLLSAEAGVNSWAYGMNDSERVVGCIANSEGRTRGILWDGDDVVDLGGLGDGDTQAMAINSSCQIVGVSNFTRPIEDGLYENGSHAFVWRNGDMTDLGTLWGAYSVAFDINNSGEIVGYSTAHGPGGLTEIHGFLWRSGDMTDLGALECADNPMSVAIAVNSSTQVVGTSTITWKLDPNAPQVRHSVSHAFIWQGGAMYDLNELTDMPPGWELTCASDISDSGLIVGMGSYAQDDAHAATTRAFLLRPIAGADL